MYKTVTYYFDTMSVEINIRYNADRLDDVIKTILDFIMALNGETIKRVQKVRQETKKAEPKPKKVRKTRAKFDDQQKADIVQRYKAGEGPKAIAESLGVARSTIGLIIKEAGAVEGRTGAHLNKPKPEPQPEEPVPV